MHFETELASTNLRLRELWQADHELPHGTVIATDNQTGGRGRQGRGWVTLAGEAIAISVLIRDFEKTGLGPGWMSLLTGSAVLRAIADHVPAGFTPKVKWPNDVYLVVAAGAGFKIAGILGELLPDMSIIMGVGLNLFTAKERLPAENAISLRSAGGTSFESTLQVGGKEFALEIARGVRDNILAMAEGAHDLARVRQIVTADSFTIGQQVRAHMSAGSEVVGEARAIADDGALVIYTPENTEVMVNAGDVWHLRRFNARQ